jgi:acetyltransferase-like isoleucine patch superfamily enzyme
MIHPTAEVEPGAKIGPGSRIWHHCHVRSGASIGANCILGYGVYVDVGVTIGDACKLQNRVSVYHGVTIEDGVFVGPHVAFTNDKRPRAIRADGAPSMDDDWTVSPTLVRHGASIGAGAVILPGITIGEWAMVGAGAVVTRDVPDHGLVTGNPARQTGYVCRCGQGIQSSSGSWICARCGLTYNLPPIGGTEVSVKQSNDRVRP